MWSVVCVVASRYDSALLGSRTEMGDCTERTESEGAQNSRKMTNSIRYKIKKIKIAYVYDLMKIL